MSTGLDWTRIDSDRRFHTLVNDWLLSELNYAYEPGDPSAGADLGWDGLYTGTLRFVPERPAGVWMCQAKYTKKQYGEAKKWLLRELHGSTSRSGKSQPGEIEKAVKARADYLLVLTQAPLKADQANAIANADSTGRLKGIVVLHRSKLEALLLQRRWVVHHFFGLPMQPGLEPGREFARRQPSLPVASLQFVGRSSTTAEVIAAVNAHWCTLVVGATGAGKTRLLCELAARTDSPWPQRILYFYNELRAGDEIVQDELVPGSDYVIVIDDSDLHFDRATKYFVKLAQQRAGSVRLILVSGEGARATMERKLAAEGVFQLRVVTLPDLDEESAKGLIAQHLPGMDAHGRQALARATGGNPLLLGLAIQSIAIEQPATAFASNSSLRSYLLHRASNHARACLSSISIELDSLLAAIACLTPLPQHSIGHLRELLGLAEEDDQALSAALSSLCEARVLRRVGRTYRFAPDLIGDLVLADRLSRSDSSVFVDRVLLPSITSQTDRVITNLLHASREPAVEMVIEQTLDRWSAEERVRPTEHRKERLAAAVHLAYVEPERVLSLVETVLFFPIPDAQLADNWTTTELFERIARDEPVYRSLSTDDIGAPLEVAGRHPSTVRRALLLIPHLANAKKGQYDNYKPESLVERWHSPTVVALQTIASGLATCAEWIEEASGRHAALAIRGALTVLQVSWRYERWDEQRLVIGAIAGDSTDEMRDLRRRATMLLSQAVEHRNASVRLLACKAVGDLGEGGLALYAEDLPLKECATSERRDLYRLFRERFRTEQHLGVLHQMASVLLRAWLGQRSCSDVAQAVLRDLEWTPELAAYGLAVDGAWDAVDDLPRLLATAPSENRWEWWVHSGVDRHHNGRIADLARQHAELVQRLDERYPGIDGFIALLSRLSENDCAPQGTPPWLFAFRELRPEYFEALWSGAGAERVPHVFRESLLFVWALKTERAFERARARFGASLAEEAPEGLLWLLRVLQAAADRPTHGALAELFTEIAASPSIDVRREVALLASWIGLSPQQQLSVFCTAMKRAFDDKIGGRILWLFKYGLRGETIETAELRSVLTGVVADIEEQHESDFGELVAWSVSDIEQYVEMLEHLGAAGMDMGALRPSRFWHRKPDLIRSGDDVARLTAKVNSWSESLRKNRAAWFLRGVGEAYPAQVCQFIRELPQPIEPVSTLLALLSDIPFESAVEAWLRLVSLAQGNACWQMVANAFEEAAGTVRSYSSTGDEEPPALHHRVHTLRTLEGRDLEPAVTLMLGRARESVERDLTRFRQEREEERDPR